MFCIEKTTARFKLKLAIEKMGKDLNVSLHGGDAAHIGAVALAVPHAGLRESGKTDVSVSVLAVTGHKEDELARKFAYTLASAFRCIVSVSCGIHLENATKQEIVEVLKIADLLLDQALQELAQL
ncbi:hypothetical protein [Maridesulfovibrio sp.]|uniref:prenylated flavin chaperone LpdD n=1 Tax=Maridesulfovibrio sp. TaxID=2795000 RepID=UPI0029F53FE3|nr:hypothetical protein [Maridesulfovibrio sp.]